jgi:hypothetical protein
VTWSNVINSKIGYDPQVGILVRKLSDNGFTLNPTKMIHNDTTLNFLPHIVATGNYVYVTWIRNSDYEEILNFYISKSTDIGNTYSAPVFLSQALRGQGGSWTIFDIAPQSAIVTSPSNSKAYIVTSELISKGFNPNQQDMEVIFRTAT